jgi:hypothetical protein
VAAALSGIGGKDAAALAVAQQYIEAFGKLARTSTTLMLVRMYCLCRMRVISFDSQTAIICI